METRELTVLKLFRDTVEDEDEEHIHGDENEENVKRMMNSLQMEISLPAQCGGCLNGCVVPCDSATSMSTATSLVSDSDYSPSLETFDFAMDDLYCNFDDDIGEDAWNDFGVHEESVALENDTELGFQLQIPPS